MSLAEEVGKLDYEVRTFLDTIESVTICEGRIKEDPKTWEIKFNGINTPLEIDAEALDSTIAFRRKYLKLTNTPAPGIKGSEWYICLKYMAEIATISQTREESDNVFVAEALFELIRDLTPIKKELVLKGAKGYVPHEGYRCVHLYVIKELMEGLNFKLTPRILSTSLTQLGYKEEGTPAIYVKDLKKHVRFWWFKEEHFNGGVDQ